jgi:hypothetical protein
MKKIKLDLSKLKLKKNTIVTLSQLESDKVIGGHQTPPIPAGSTKTPQHCTGTCPGYGC